MMTTRDEGYLIALKDVRDLLTMIAAEPGKTIEGKAELRAAVYYLNDLILAKMEYLTAYRSSELTQVA